MMSVSFSEKSHLLDNKALAGGNDLVFYTGGDTTEELPNSSENRRLKKFCFVTLPLVILGGILLTISYSQNRYALYMNTGKENLRALPKNTQSVSTLNKLTLGCKATFVIIPHCESDLENNQHCSYLGLERARYISTLFGSRWPDPSYIFAASAWKAFYNETSLEIETVLPVAAKANITIDSSYSYDQSKLFSKHLLFMLGNGSICDKVVLISWKQRYIPRLAAVLGCGTKNGCPSIYPNDSFDQAWILTFVYENESFLESYFYQEDDDWATRNNKKKKNKKPQWRVFGTVTDEHFDLLSIKEEQ